MVRGGCSCFDRSGSAFGGRPISVRRRSVDTPPRSAVERNVPPRHLEFAEGCAVPPYTQVPDRFVRTDRGARSWSMRATRCGAGRNFFSARRIFGIGVTGSARAPVPCGVPRVWDPVVRCRGRARSSRPGRRPRACRTAALCSGERILGEGHVRLDRVCDRAPHDLRETPWLDAAAGALDREVGCGDGVTRR